MPVAPTYPGVYIEELPSGVRTIVAVPASIAAFVGYTARGLDHRATRVQSFADFERAFGGLDRDSELSYAVAQYFLNGGGDAFVVRVPKHDAVAGRITLKNGTTNAAAPTLVVTALSRGSWANSVAIDVDHVGIPTADTMSFNLTVTDLATGATERFSGVTVNAASKFFVETVVNDPDSGSRMISVDVPANVNTRPRDAGTSGSDITLADLENDKNYTIRVSSDVPVGAIDDVLVTVIAQGETLPTSVAGVCALVERKITEALTAVRPGARVRCVPSASGLGLRVMADFDPATLPGGLDAVLTFTAGEPDSALEMLGLDDVTLTPNVARYVVGSGRTVAAQSDATAGADGTALPTSADLIGSQATFTGIHALRRVDLFTILSIPDATRATPGNPDALDQAVDPNAIFTAAMELCRERRAMLIVDPPPFVRDVNSALDWITDGLTAKGPDAAAYFPRVRIPDPLNDFQPRTVAPSGTMAGVWARTDAGPGVWKAPGGTESRLLGVTGLVYRLTDGENGILNPLGLNALRTLPVFGNVSWGARTLDGADVLASQWKYLPVRRLAKLIEESAFRGSQWAVFQPNDEPLWAQLRLNLTSFMQGLFRQGAFQGKSPREAYLVKCDAQTTTQDDIDRGVVNVLLGFAPLKPAEFVFIRIQQLAGQSQA
jgi:phage tail sheath protein FI